MDSRHNPSWCERINAPRPASPDAGAAAPPPEPEPAAGPAPGRVTAPTSPSTAARTSFFTPREIPAEHLCERCGTIMYDHNCKIVCPNCGYKRDCSDP